MTETIKTMLNVYFIAGTQDCQNRSLQEVLQAALEAGISCYQFREKGPGSLEKEPEALLKTAVACRELCRAYEVPFIVNDDLQLAERVKADGIHVGQGDLPIAEVVRRMGDQFMIGLSTNNLKQFLEAEKTTGIDYVGIGPAYTPKSKQDHEAVMGLNGIREAMQKRTRLPAVAIGGISEDNVQEVRQTGVDGVAIVSAITQSRDIRATLKKLKETN
ncbi:Thiamin-phosphate pyrophosphorylase [Alkalibacterium sp. AK22]|uniref:thiamine phosphate synthase n=1 Tax=Alkalibacterium sp. AK22 TaxID=1229520 RepID=UPI0004467E63|nr:thiamine phosphate synthase [Alkalibacterium sp. AK22]EXJ24064.1 Thiamin-phosphate pyrophosphorylase [Alkalibacterium sp. AK22]